MLNLLMDRPDPMDLNELSDRARVSARTIRYYIQQGLLPAPEARGPGAHYGPEHVDRLLLIRRLQREHLPLSEIRKRIETLSPAEVRRIVQSEPERPPDSASDYVRRVLTHGSAPLVALESRVLSDPRPSLPRDQSRKASTYTRSQWERFTLAPDVELHVRRPVSREDN